MYMTIAIMVICVITVIVGVVVVKKPRSKGSIRRIKENYKKVSAEVICVETNYYRTRNRGFSHDETAWEVVCRYNGKDYKSDYTWVKLSKYLKVGDTITLYIKDESNYYVDLESTQKSEID